MKKLFLALLFLFMISSVSAFGWTNTTFNNSLTTETIFFTGNQNITRWLSIPSTVTSVFDGFFNISGFVSSTTNSTGLVNYWTFDNTLNDTLVGLNYTDDGTLNFVSGKNNNMLNISQTNASTESVLTVTGNSNRTFNFWGKIESIGSNQKFFAQGIGVLEKFMFGTQGTGWKFDAGGAGGEIGISNADTLEHMFTVTYNGTSVGIYIDGVFNTSKVMSLNTDSSVLTLGLDALEQPTQKANLTLDEFSVWNRSLTQTDVDNLYAFGNGNFHPFTPGINTTLFFLGQSDPLNLSISSNGTSPITIKISNLSSSINAHLNSTFLVGSNYLIPFIFHSDNIGNLTYSNMFFTNIGFTQDSISFTNTTTEGQTENFELNITIGSEVALTNANLNYNNTNFVSTITQVNATTYRITNDLQIENVLASSNVSFFWSFDLEGTSFNSTFNNQTINNLGVDDCSVNTFLLLNYTLRDEDTQALVTVPSNATIRVDVNIFPVGSTSSIIQFSQEYAENDTALVCLESDLGTSAYTMDVQTQYGLDDYATEFHNIDSFNLTNSTVPQTIALLDLLTTRAQSFVITVKDSNFLPLSGAIVDVTRKYVADGVFRSVEVPLTDASGQASVSLVQNSEIYTFIISKDGVLLATFDNVVAVCQNQVTGECNIFLNLFTSSTALTDFENFNGLSFTETFDRSARTITVLFSTNDGSNAEMFINTTLFDRFGNTTVCSDSLTSSSGTLTCLIPESFGNQTVQSQIFKDGLQISNNFYNLNDGSPEFGSDGIIMALILIITLPLMFVTSAVGVVIVTMLGVIISGLLLLYTGGSLFGVSSTVTWLIVAGSILVWRMTRGG